MRQVLREARENSKRVSILGSGRHSRFRGADLEVFMKEMNSFTIKDKEVVAEAGASVEEIRKEASSQDQLFPVLYNGTVGGLIALNEPTTLSTSFGLPSDLINWIRGVTVNHTVITRLFAGSKGRMAAITAASFKLFERPKSTFTAEKIVKPEEVKDEVIKLADMKPLSLVVDYNTAFKVHATFTRKPGMKHYVIDEGVTYVEENDAEALTVFTRDPLQVLIDVGEKLKPSYAYLVVGTGQVKVYNVEKGELSKVIPTDSIILANEELHPLQRFVARIFDYRRMLT